VFVGGERGKEARDLRRAHFLWMAFVVEEDEAYDPGPIDLLGPGTQMTQSHRADEPIAELGTETGL
jgi:hypothetical protein